MTMFVINNVMDMKEEKWLPVVDWEELYMVSDHGRVRSLDRYVNGGGGGKALKKGKILSLLTYKIGYKFIRLCHAATNRDKHMLVHRLVAEAFIPNTNGLPQVNHKNEKKDDNRVENLEWCTPKYNKLYNDSHIKGGKKLRKVVYQYDMEHNLIKEWESATVAAKEGDYERSNIAAAARGVYKHHRGFIWSYRILKLK